VRTSAFGRSGPRFVPVALLAACARGPAADPAEPRDQAPAPAGAGARAGEPSAVDGEAEAPVPLSGVSHPGCFMLLPLGQGPPRWAGEQPCDERTSPNSTFKIPHALIALDTGVVTDVDAMVQWDGKPRWIDAWNRDASLRTAIYESVVWFFQGTARAIGRERMREYLEAFEYGNAAVDGPIDMFWLDDGSLRISPEESLRFMARLYRDELPRAREHLPRLRELLVRPPASFAARMPDGTPVPSVHPELIFSAKTGTGSHPWPPPRARTSEVSEPAADTGKGEGSVTWLVGHVACPGRAYVFVSRVIAPEEPQTSSPAVTHGLAVLDRLGVLRCE
jgi:beta-lactamase class D